MTPAEWLAEDDKKKKKAAALDTEAADAADDKEIGSIKKAIAVDVRSDIANDLGTELVELDKKIAASTDFSEDADLRRKREEIRAGLVPVEPLAYAGQKPTKTDATKLLGVIPLSFNPSNIPINAPAKVSVNPADAFRPQIVIGPASKELYSEVDNKKRVSELFDEKKMLEESASKTPEEQAQLKEELAASKKMLVSILKSNPRYTDEELLAQYKLELDDIPARLSGTSTRPGAIQKTIEIGKAPSVASSIYSKQTTPGSKYQEPTTAQREYLSEYQRVRRSRLSKEVEKEIRDQVRVEKIEDPLLGVPPKDPSNPWKVTGYNTRSRTPEEVETEVTKRMAGAIDKADIPAWATDTGKRQFSNPEDYVRGGGLFEQEYPTGATREGTGAYALRMALSPLNLVFGGASSGLIRTIEAVKGNPSSLDAARKERNDKTSSLPDGFIGDLASSVMTNTGATKIIGDNYKELAENNDFLFGIKDPKTAELTGNAVGFGLEMIAPPVGGIVSSGVEAGHAFSAAKSARAFGLIGAETPLAAAGKAFGSTMRDAWLWRDINAGTIAPGSFKILAAEETGKTLALRDALKGAGHLDADELKAFVADWALKNEGGGKVVKDFNKAAREKNGVELFVAELTKPVADIAPKGDYLSGATKLVEEFDRIVGKTGHFDESEALLKTIIRNASGRGEVASLIEKLPHNAPTALVSAKIARDARDDFRRAVGALVSFDAFNKGSKAKGFAEFDDLVLASDRYIVSPDVAIKAAEESQKTSLGIFLKNILYKGRDTKLVAPSKDLNKMIDISVAAPKYKQVRGSVIKAESVIELAPEEAAQTAKFVTSLKNSGFINDGEATNLIMSLSKKQLSMRDIRTLADANMSYVISKMGRGVDVGNIKAIRSVSDFKPATGFGTAAYNKIGTVVGEKLAEQRDISQLIARNKIYSPKEARSILDGVVTRAKVLAGEKVNMQSLALDPKIAKRIEEYSAALSQIDKKIKQLAHDLSGPNPELRAAYNLPETGILTQDDIIRAIMRGTSKDDAKAFILSATRIIMQGSELKAGQFGLVDRAFFDLNSDKYLTKEGQEALAKIQRDYLDLLVHQKEDYIDVPDFSIDDLYRDIREKILDDPPKTTEVYKHLVKNVPGSITEPELTKVIGAALYDREALFLKNDIIADVLASHGSERIYDQVRKDIKEPLIKFLKEQKSHSSQGSVITTTHGGGGVHLSDAGLAKFLTDQGHNPRAVPFFSAVNGEAPKLSSQRLSFPGDADTEGIVQVTKGRPYGRVMEIIDEIESPEFEHKLVRELIAKELGHKFSVKPPIEFDDVIDPEYDSMMLKDILQDSDLLSPGAKKTFDEIAPRYSNWDDNPREGAGMFDAIFDVAVKKIVPKIQESVDRQVYVAGLDPIISKELAALDPNADVSKIRDILVAHIGQSGKSVEAGNRSLLTGRIVEDSIDKFYSVDTLSPILETINKDSKLMGIPAKQKVFKWAGIVFDGIANAKYHSMLYLRPAYHVGNAVTAPAIIHATVGLPNMPAPVDFFVASKLFGPQKEIGFINPEKLNIDSIAFVSASGKPYTYRELKELGTGSGLFKTEAQTQFNPKSYEEVIKFIESNNIKFPQAGFDAAKALATMPASFANESDNFFRNATFIKALRGGAPESVAQTIGKKSLFDFGSLSKGEQEFARRYLIFYTFQRLSAEVLIKSLTNPSSLARFIKQAAMLKDTERFAYDLFGGKDFDEDRILMSDKDASRFYFPKKDVGAITKQTQFTAGVSSVASWMLLADLLYSRNTSELAFGTETGIGQFFNPAIKVGIKNSEEKDQDRREDKLHLVKPEHMAIINTVPGAPLAFKLLFGIHTPIEPDVASRTTYLDKEWQLDAKHYAAYRGFKWNMERLGLDSAVDTWAPIIDSDLDKPGGSRFEKIIGLSTVKKPSLEESESTILDAQSKYLGDLKKFREEQLEKKEK